LSILLSIFMSLKGAMEILRLPFALINQGIGLSINFEHESYPYFWIQNTLYIIPINLIRDIK